MIARHGFLRGAAAVAAAGLGFATAIAQSLPTVRIAWAASDTFAGAQYAYEKGYFKDAGLTVEMTQLGNGGAIATAVGSGTIDVGVVNVLTLANAYLRGVPFAFLTSGGLYNAKANEFCVPDGSPIRTAKDTAGGTFAISSLRGTEWLAVQAWIDENGGDSTKIKLLEITYPEVAAAAKRGAISGGMLTEPYLSQSLAAGGIHAIATPFDTLGKNLMIAGWFSTQTWIAANPVAARRFVDAMYATAKWANAHHDETAEMLSRYAKIPLPVVKTMNRCAYGESLTPSNMQTAYDFALKYKVFARPVNANEVIAKL